MAVRHFISGDDHKLITELVEKHGLRPHVDAVGCAARELVEIGKSVKDEYGDQMDDDDVQTAAHVLTNGDLY